eukprot:TRINITY_DN2971_c0_g1_i1.p1 TRINITY_DN2971_c0_g1~~TRINITY_DN2971_c0_g1_i1.p1  ORF type:complete len:222 (-),score=53.84 TRINITY_DN2971_c0_g1_i1:5-637(-)
MFRLGLTGGIASGKSRAAQYLRDIGVTVLDADLLGHRAYQPGTTACKQIIDQFGPSVVSSSTGGIDRAALGKIVFGSSAHMKSLTDIVWPEIKRIALEEIQTAESRTRGSRDPKERIIVLEAAVLVEAGWDSMMDRTWMFQVPPVVARSRLMSRNNLTEEEADRRIAAQLTNEERAKHADLIIDTNRDPSQTQAAVLEAWKALEDETRGK